MALSLAALLAPALILSVQAQEAQAQEAPTPPNYTQASVCEVVGRRVVDLVAAVEEASGETEESRALYGQAESLVTHAVAARAASAWDGTTTEQERADIDALVAERLAGADQTQFENAVLNCFTLFGIE